MHPALQLVARPRTNSRFNAILRPDLTISIGSQHQDNASPQPPHTTIQ